MTNKELLEEQTGQPQNGDATELITREPLEGTPFQLIGHAERGYFIAIGNYRITEPTKGPDEAIAMLETHKWDIILTICSIMMELKEKDKQTTN